MLVFQYGTMSSGKSTMLLQVAYNKRQLGNSVRVFTCLDRSNASEVSSRLGARSAADLFDKETVFDETLISETVVLVDEAQFLTSEQVVQLSFLADLGREVICFGLLSDFKTDLFEGSKRLVELSDRLIPLPLGASCWCGEVGVVNARLINGEVSTEGNVIEIGDVDDGSSGYQVLCRKHWRQRLVK